MAAWRWRSVFEEDRPGLIDVEAFHELGRRRRVERLAELRQSGMIVRLEHFAQFGQQDGIDHGTPRTKRGETPATCLPIASYHHTPRDVAPMRISRKPRFCRLNRGLGNANPAGHAGSWKISVLALPFAGVERIITRELNTRSSKEKPDPTNCRRLSSPFFEG